MRWHAGMRPSIAFVVMTAILALGFQLSTGRIEAQVTVRTRAGEVSSPVFDSAVLQLPFDAGHLAVRWAGNSHAQVSVATSVDGRTFGPPTDVGRDETGEQKGNGVSYGAILTAGGATAVRITSDVPLGVVTVLALADGERVTSHRQVPGRPAGASVTQPPTISRAEWGADESLRFAANGRESWGPTEFWPSQKLIVHHTAGSNNDPNPAATMRSIYYYHAVTQGWGDIGYNFLIDEAGRIYKGRYSGPVGTRTADTLTGENAAGHGVTAAHSYGFNSGTVGVALLGTLTTQAATTSARSALVDHLAWEADKHGIAPTGRTEYVNPVNQSRKTFDNIAGHRDVSATDCPGGAFYDTLPALRTSVASRIAATTTTSSTISGSSTTTTVSSTTTVAPSTTTTVRRGKKR